MNSDDLQKIAYEEIGGEEIFDPRRSMLSAGHRFSDTLDDIYFI